MPTSKHSSNRDIKYVCHECGKDTPRDGLTVKRVRFETIGSTNQKVLRSRTIAWLCEPCRDADPTWNREAFMAAPGLEDVRRVDATPE